jgi:hypothetical protein
MTPYFEAPALLNFSLGWEAALVSSHRPRVATFAVLSGLARSLIVLLPSAFASDAPLVVRMRRNGRHLRLSTLARLASKFRRAGRPRTFEPRSVQRLLSLVGDSDQFRGASVIAAEDKLAYPPIETRDAALVYDLA